MSPINGASVMKQEQIVAINKQIKEVDREICELQNKKKTLINAREKLKLEIQEQKSAELANEDWDKDFSWTTELHSILINTFNINSLRPHQLPAMNATLSGTDCILIMPTGGGKSLCYQLPALISKGVTLVVSPLISLIEDQLMCLQKLKIEAKMLSASCSKQESNAVLNAMTDPKSPMKLLYVTPERLAKSKRFMSKLQKMHQMGRFSRLAIDEIHCCSHWGHDFRPDYKFLGIMRQMFTGTPIIGLTATATSRVIADVQKILNIQGCLILKASFNRPNLFYEVRSKSSSQKECAEELYKLLKKDFKDQSGIIYTMTIKDTEELTKDLRGMGLRVAPYHAQLDGAVRSKIHRKWIENDYQAVVATIAFGMGIDKPDVRFIIHHCISKSMENFYQESGRAGRDDKPARCIVFWRLADLFRQSTMVFTENTGLDNLYGMISYCLDARRCRRHLIADHFDEAWESKDCNNMCDHCSRNLETKESDLSHYGSQLLKILEKASNLKSRLTGLKLIDAWLGKGATNLRIKEATASGLDRDRAENIVAHMVVDGYLKEDFHFTPYSTISYILPGSKAEAGLPPSPMEIAKARSSTRVNSTSSTSRRKTKHTSPNDRGKKRPIDDSEDEQGDEPEEKSNGGSNSVAPSKKMPLVVIDSDSDEDS